MATLYVENVPDELYEPFASEARKNRKSIAAEVLTLVGTENSHGAGTEGATRVFPPREASAVAAVASAGTISFDGRDAA